MIDSIQGIIEEVGLDYIILNSNSIAYYIQMSSKSLEDITLYEDRKIYTKLIVKEDDMQLVGFSNKNERTMYNLLTGVSKVGIKLALAMLSVYAPSDIIYFISTNDDDSLSKVSGFGQKTAQRMIIELKDKIKNLDIIPSEVKEKVQINQVSGFNMNKNQDDAVEALISLGFSKKEASQAVIETSSKDDNYTTSDLIKKALIVLNKK